MDPVIHVWFEDISLLISGKSLLEIYAEYRAVLEGLR